MDKMDAHMPYDRLPDVELGGGDSGRSGQRRRSSFDGADGVTATAHAPHKRPLSLLPLVALIFFEVSGGPFGTEDAVAAAGPLLVILGFVVFPILWSVPEALITAELATAFPENSGYVAWVSAAFGPFWGFQEGWWSWLSGVTDNSIYPVMLADNLRLFFPSLGSGWQRCVALRSSCCCLWEGGQGVVCILFVVVVKEGATMARSSHLSRPPTPCKKTGRSLSWRCRWR
jgi:amino acid transporter